jgi:hypothetical protein
MRWRSRDSARAAHRFGRVTEDRRGLRAGLSFFNPDLVFLNPVRQQLGVRQDKDGRGSGHAIARNAVMTERPRRQGAGHSFL